MHDMVDHTFVGRLENFVQDLERLRGLASLPDVPIDHKNKKGGAKEDLLDGRPDRARRIERLYARDFEAFGYDI